MFNQNFNPYAVNPYAVQYQPQTIQNIPQNQNIQPQNNQMNTSGIIWVSGFEEANNYIVAPNNAVALWDRSGKAIYLKSADATGLTNVRILDISERKSAQNEELNNKVEFVSLDDFNVLKGNFEDLKSIVENLTNKKTKKEVKTDE